MFSGCARFWNAADAHSLRKVRKTCEDGPFALPTLAQGEEHARKQVAQHMPLAFDG